MRRSNVRPARTGKNRTNVEVDREPLVMLLSPAKLNGKRGRMLFNPEAEFSVARELRSSAGAPLAEVFSFVSGLYFRGKVDYAREFARTYNGLPAALVISA